MRQLNKQNIGSRPAIAPKKAQRANFFIRWSFVLFIFLMPFETWSPFSFKSFTVTKMAGILFAFFCLFQRRLCFALPPRAFWCFVSYLVIYNCIGIFYSVGYEEALLGGFMTLGQNMLLFWLTYNLMRDDKLVKLGLLSFSVGCVALGCMMLAGVGQTVDITYNTGRVTGLKENANDFAFLMSIGLLVLVGMAVGRGKVKTKWLLLLAPVSMLMLYHIIQSGSRGGMLCFGVGLLVLVCRKAGWYSKGLTLLVVVLLLVGGMREIQQTEIATKRWQRTLEKHDLSDRDMIQRASLGMFFEKPIFGWGPYNHLIELLKRAGHVRYGVVAGAFLDTHNDILWVMTATGIAGTIPIVMAVGFCVMGAWHGRKTIQGLLPLSLIMALLIMSQTGTMFNRKITWIVFAYAAVSGTYPAVLAAKRASRLRRKELMGSDGVRSRGVLPDIL